MNAPTSREIARSAEVIYRAFDRRPAPGRFEAVLAAARAAARERYDVHPTYDGYVIREWGEVIATFHGPQSELAGRLLAMLKADALQASQEGNGVRG